MITSMAKLKAILKHQSIHKGVPFIEDVFSQHSFSIESSLEYESGTTSNEEEISFSSHDMERGLNDREDKWKNIALFERSVFNKSRNNPKQNITTMLA